ncbi:MAG: hypothetical protein Q9209_000436 [Squamulea sp. 1 TL-2023]
MTSRANALLPFLYYTRTILSSATKSSRTQSYFHTGRSRQVRIVKTDAIPFEDGIGDRANDDLFRHVVEKSAGEDFPAQSTGNGTNRPLRNSTITASEKAVFERIFKEISDDASRKAAEQTDPLEKNLEVDEPPHSDAYSDLNALFDWAISKSDRAKQQRPSEGADKKHPDQTSRRFMTALDAFGATPQKILRISITRNSEDVKKIQTSVLENNRKVMQKIDEAKTDREIWNVLESEVFTLIKQYESQKKDLEEQDKPKKRKRGSLSKADKEATAAKEKKQSLQARNKTFQQAETEAILSSNYSDYCLAAMRNLRRTYPASPYAMNLLPTVKRLGSISHVLAASVDLYNEILFLLWSQYNDLHGMADLITEMGNQGIESNETTLRVLRMVSSARSRAIVEDKSMKLWWRLAPVEAGWSRVQKIADKVYLEILQAKARRAMEGDIASSRDVEAKMRTERDPTQTTSSEKDLRAKRFLADEATIMNGGLDMPLSPV